MKTSASLVIGAAGGVGLELVKQLTEAGHRVTGSVRSDAEAALARREVASLNVVHIDLSRADLVPACLDPVLQGLPGGLDNAIYCAGVSPYGPLETTPISGVRQTIEINTIGALAVYQACIPYLRASRGRLVFLSSIAGKVALPFVGGYAASKFALEGLADVMRREAARWGVKVVVVEPGGIHTPMVLNQLRSIGTDRANLSPRAQELYGKQYENFEALLKQSLAQALHPAAVAKAVLSILGEDGPKSRYPIGEAAQYLCDSAARMPDEDLDAIVAKFTSGVD